MLVFAACAVVHLFRRSDSNISFMPGEALLQELLFCIQNPTNQQVFIERCAALFAKDDSKAWIDLYQPRITPPVQNRAPAEFTSPGAGPSSGAATTPSVGDDIEYD